jgi:hypothetical protein
MSKVANKKSYVFDIPEDVNPKAFIKSLKKKWLDIEFDKELNDLGFNFSFKVFGEPFKVLALANHLEYDIKNVNQLNEHFEV